MCVVALERELSAEVQYVPTSTRKQLDTTFKKSPFLHCRGTEPQQMHSFYYDIAREDM